MLRHAVAKPYETLDIEHLANRGFFRKEFDLRDDKTRLETLYGIGEALEHFGLGGIRRGR